MLPKRQVLGSSRKLVQEFRPGKIVLFGSYTCGTGTADSYVDYS